MLKSKIENFMTKFPTKRSTPRYIEKLDPTLWDEILEATSFLKGHVYPKQRVWHIMNDTYEVPLCPVDNIPVRWFDNRYLQYSSLSAKSRCPNNAAKRTSTMRTNRGVNMSEREKYRNDVWSETKKSWRQHKDKIPNVIRRGREWHLDHKLSIEYGYLNNVDPKIIGHWRNFEIIKASENYAKHNRSSISLDELLAAISQ